MRASGRRDRAGVADRLEQRDLAWAELAAGVEIEAKRDARRHGAIVQQRTRGKQTRFDAQAGWISSRDATMTDGDFRIDECAASDLDRWVALRFALWPREPLEALRAQAAELMGRGEDA